jgi:hypothetical protein
VIKRERISNPEQKYQESNKEMTMKCVFVNSGLDDYLAEKIEKGQIHSNIQEPLPKRELKVQMLYKALERGKSFLNGFSLPGQEERELKKALSVISEAIEREEKKQQEPVITEQELLEALDYLEEIARERKR